MPPRSDLPLIAALAIAVVGMTLAGLDAIDFVRQSECRTAVVAREMLDSGNFLTPTVNGRPRFEKPPLYYWAIAAVAGATHGTVDEGVARLPSVLSALAAVLALSGFARQRARASGRPSTVAAGLAGLTLLCLPGFWQRATLADAESLLTLSCFAVSACLYGHLRRPRAALLLSAYGLSAVAFLAKGPIFLFFTWPAYLWLARRELKDQCRWHGLGLLIFIAGALSWYIAVWWRDAQALDVFRRELAMRFDSQTATHPQPLWFYFGQLFESTLPLGLLLPGALCVAWRQRRDRAEAFLLGNAMVAFAGLTLLKTKQAHYLMPLLPWLALWLSDLAWHTLENRRWRWVITGGLIIGSALTAVAAVLAYGYGVAWSAPIFLLLAAAVLGMIRRRSDRPLYAALLGTLAFTVGGYLANETVFKPLRALKFQHGAYFEALRALPIRVDFDDACFYYYYRRTVQHAADPLDNGYLLSAGGDPHGELLNHHRSRMEWLWRTQQSPSPTSEQPLLSADGAGDFTPSHDLRRLLSRPSSCSVTEVWANREATVLKIAVDGACSAQRLLADLSAADGLLQAQLTPWKLLWLETHDLPTNPLRRWPIRQVLGRWAETSDAQVLLDRDGLIGKTGKRGLPLTLTRPDFDNAGLAINGAALELNGADVKRRWRRSADGAHLRLLSENHQP